MTYQSVAIFAHNILKQGQCKLVELRPTGKKNKFAELGSMENVASGFRRRVYVIQDPGAVQREILLGILDEAGVNNV